MGIGVGIAVGKRDGCGVGRSDGLHNWSRTTLRRKRKVVRPFSAERSADKRDTKEKEHRERAQGRADKSKAKKKRKWTEDEKNQAPEKY